MKTSKLFITSLLVAAAMGAVPAFATVSTGSVTVGGTWDNDASSYLTATKDSVGQYYFVAGSNTPADAIAAESAISDDIVIGGTNVDTDSTKGLIITDSNQKCQALTGTISGVGILAIKASTGYGTSQLVFSGDVSGFSGKFYVNTANAHTLRFMGASTTALSGTGTIETNKTLVYEKETGDTYAIANSSISAQTLQFTGGANYTISSTLAGNNATASNNTLTISAGTTTFTGAVSNFGNVTVASGATFAVGASGNVNLSSATFAANGTGAVSVAARGSLNLSGARVTLASAIANSGTVTISDTTVFNLTQTGATTLIDGGTIAGFDWNSLTSSNFTYNGAVLTARSTVDVSNAGAVTLSSVIADLTWTGNASTTWDVGSSQNWTNASTSAADVFYNYDNVTFDASTTGTTTNIAAGVTVTNLTISGGTHTFTRSNSGYVVVTGTATIQDGATLVLGSKTDDLGLIRAESLTVESGGSLEFYAGDATGYNGGNTSLKKIVVADGGFIVMNENANETFAGTLELGGTLKNGERASSDTYWDMFGSSAIKATSANARIETTLRIRRANGVITIMNGSHLTIAGDVVIGSGGTDTLKVDADGNGSGAFTFTGSSGTFGSGIRLASGNFVVGDGTNASLLTTSRVEIGDGTDGSNALEVKTGSTLKITGTANDWSVVGNYKSNAAVLGEWSTTTTATIAGTLLASGAEIGVGDSGGSIVIENGGVLAAKGIGQGVSAKAGSGKFELMLNDGGKLVLGESGIGTVKTTSSVSFGAGTVATFADSLSLGSATLTSTAGTVFDTTKYEFAADGNSIAAGATSAEIAVTGVLSGSGALVKTGAGTLTLSGHNTYSGGTTIEGGVLKVDSLGWGDKGNLGTKFTQDGTVLKNGGLLEVTEAQNASSGSEYRDGGALRGFSVTNGEGTYRYSGSGTSLVSHNSSYDAQNQHIGVAAGATLIFDVTQDSATLDVSKIIASNATQASMSDALAETTGALKKIGAGTVILSGANLYSGGTTISAGRLVAAHAGALGTGVVTVESGAELGLVAGTTLTIANGVELASGAKLLVDMTSVASETETFTLDLVSGTALSYNGDGITSANADILLGALELDGWNQSGWTQSLAYIDGSNTLQLTMTIPEPSVFGLLAGLGALALAGTRRRRRK